ncbi:MAG: thiamine phosphate synthase [Actinomycetaceae bacterium]|nr:thiamine phosphate synthase [Actinomycetaceae bacterium]MDY6082890.1 thiamine phosphate synthase [Actinomycetaceae bacterium]
MDQSTHRQSGEVFPPLDLRHRLRLYLVTDSRWLAGRSLADVVRQAIEGGVTCVQFREKNVYAPLNPKERRQQAILVRDVCRRYSVPFLVDDDVDLAARVDADGVHIGQSDATVHAARAVLGRDKIIGVSAQTPQQALDAQESGADYLGVGALFATSSKDDAATVSFSTLHEICHAVRIPVVAIGGISPDNVAFLADSGIAGISVISAIMAAPDISTAARKLDRLVQHMIPEA